MEKLESYVAGEWIAGKGKPAVLVDPTTEEPVAEAGTEGVDFGKAVAYARDVGGAALRALTFAERGELLRAFSRAIHAHRDELIELAVQNCGNTRGDAKFDIDGASGTLAWYADLGKELGAQRFLVDGEGIQLGRGPRFVGQHVFVPRAGVAVHVNAFNFPAWGLAEKAACALLAGMPVISKPATSTAVVAHRIMRVAVDVLPKGALSFVAGAPGDLLTHLTGQDVLAFTGSSDTGVTIRTMPNVVKHAVRVNVEADSLNAAVLGPDVAEGDETFHMFVRDVVRDMTQKAGQKCTAIRRVFVPTARLEAAREALASRLDEHKVGDPRVEGVTVGPLATAQQQRDVRKGIELLRAESASAHTLPISKDHGGASGKGYFVEPTLFVGDGARAKAVHEHEVFGPASTLLAYESTGDMIEQVRRGQGGLVASVYTEDRAFAGEALFGIAPFHGRVMLGSEKIADQAPGPGTVLPQMIHGGPGRAGAGEELGGVRGLAFYSQRVAVQGARPVLEALLGTKKA
ncbi:MAG TPA: 3,4-dehydroadipyl-CoA semialdehyde dehydrogenase [Byssovorax sp.]|jgi:oxepin-CoA hydrolase/3-oxo-5,6-dehydrosuberyl-CoA semialdehyde dehydrogenase